MLNEYNCLLTESGGLAAVVLLHPQFERSSGFKVLGSELKQVLNIIVMAKFKKFEDIEAWKKARKLASTIYKETNLNFNNDYTLIRQIRRSSGSVMDNIAEGFDRGGNKEFIQFLFNSKGSAAETKSQLYRALDQQYISQETFEELYESTDGITKMIGRLIQYLKNSEFKGQKYK
jgi:four helix bundle protein